MRFFDKINWCFLLKGVLVIGLESSYDCDKYNKKLILEEKKFILYFYLKVCICIMVVLNF